MFAFRLVFSLLDVGYRVGLLCGFMWFVLVVYGF